MDPRRLLILAPAALLVAGAPAAGRSPDPAGDTVRPYAASPAPPAPVRTGRRAIAAAVEAARAASRSDRFEGGVQVFAWAPGRVYEVWAAPLRVTALILSEGEVLIAKAAGDTVRWQVAETRWGAGPEGRTHVLLKPLQCGLETNLVLTTNRRVYLIALKSGSAEAFNPAVTWEAPEPAPPPPELPSEPSPSGPVTPEGPLEARYLIEARGRAPWTPSAVFDDGRRTFIAFPAGLQSAEAPALFVIGPDGEAQYVNYRQSGGLFIVDRLFDRAELRLGERRPLVVRLRRLGGDRP